jgi:CheY-like chemotaxis protein
LLAGRKLLLADDSATVQKVVELTFADEGVEVIVAGDGEEAIEKVEQLLPDVVLVDVLMPVFNGYEVCEFIKTSEKLKHIPVMLLVGSFEPFDEAEARRVGANEILTKPFKSIRRLIDRVGELVTVKPETEVPTAELPSQHEAPEERLSTAEIEMTTADTMKLPEEMAHSVHDVFAEPFLTPPPPVETPEPILVETPAPTFNEMKKDSRRPRPTQFVPETSETPLDLGDFEAAAVLEADDFELELEMEEVEVTSTTPPFAAPAFAEAKVSLASTAWESKPAKASEPVLDATAFVTAVSAEVPATQKEQRAAASSPVQGTFDPQALSPEMIDAIARRAVEHLSERTVQEIAWEVVPQLAELLIKQKLQESQPK